MSSNIVVILSSSDAGKVRTGALYGSTASCCLCDQSE